MCRMCEGFSLEDVLALDEAAIREYGFIVRGVSDPEPADGSVPWCYTIGLLDAVGHPELIVAGIRVEAGGQLLHGLARRILAGQRLAVGGRVKVGRGRARVGFVHPIHYEDGTFTSWHNLRAAGALAAPALEAVQIFAPAGWFCPSHQHGQPDLSDPGEHLDRRAA